MMRVKETDYFDFFIEAVEFSCKAAEMLHDLVVNYQNVDYKVAAIHEKENQADHRFHELVKQLNHSFITPIEREDILAISQGIDNITDKIEDIAYRFNMYHIQTVRPDANVFINLIRSGCEALLDAVKEFKNHKKSKLLTQKIIEVNRLEEEGDKLYKTAVRALFIADIDTKEIIKWKGMFETMESCMDCCEDVADLIESVVMKNS